MADYSRQLFDMFGSIGDQVVDNRKEAEGKRRYNESAARQMFNDEYNQSRDTVKDKQWADEFAQKNAYNNRYLDVLTQKAANGGEGGGYGLSPVWGTDADGNPALVQLGKNGQPIQPQLPEGFKIARDPIKMDAGTHFVLLDPQTRQQIGTIPKDVAGAASQAAIGSAEGKTTGEARSQLPGAQQSLVDVQKKIADLRDDPYLPNMLGAWDSRTPDITADAARVSGKMQQLQGETFMQARQLLKGAGPITDYEGTKADQAMARLNRAQSPADYKQALNDFQTHIENGFRILEQQAAGRGQGQQPAQAGGGGGDVLSKARAAIAAGADPRAVAERLRRVGIDPSGL